jgi:plastocyanin
MKTKLSILLVSLFLLAACGPKAPTPAGTLPPIPTAAATNTQPPIPTDTTIAAPPSVPTDTAAALSGQVDVSIAGFAFAPQDLTVKVGTTVTWANQDSATHNVVADDNSFSSPDLSTGDKFSFTFAKAGTYSYRCGFHANMKGTIVVVP